MVRLATRSLVAAIVLAGLSISSISAAHAQSALDRVIQSGKLRCGIMLDSPPSGFRNAQNEPDGFDVVYCRDMAAALGVQPEIVETPSPDRIPSLMSDRVDISMSLSNTLERGLTVAFTQPYMNYTNSVLTRSDTGITSFEQLKGRRLGGVVGTSTEQQLQAFIAEWNDPQTTYTGYASDAESFLALQQGKIDGIISATANAGSLIASGQFPEFVIAGLAPTPPDLVAMAVHRTDHEFVRWLKLFVWDQVRTGRFQEVYNVYMGPGEAPSLSVPGVDY